MFNVIRPNDKVNGDTFKGTHNDVPRTKPVVGRQQHSTRQQAMSYDKITTSPAKNNTEPNSSTTTRSSSSKRFDETYQKLKLIRYCCENYFEAR